MEVPIQGLNCKYDTINNLYLKSLYQIIFLLQEKIVKIQTNRLINREL